MTTKLLQLIAEFLEKQDMLSKLTEAECLHGYGYSDIHAIAAIGTLEAPNGSAIAQHLGMTRGAISKLTKKLMAAGVIVSYTIPGNKQKRFFLLTETGEQLFREHDRRHRLWQKRDLAFLGQFNHRQREEFAAFLGQYNAFLAQHIEQLGGNHNAN